MVTCKIGIIIQARVGATRLPNKTIMPFYENKSILEIIINKLKLKFPDVMIVVATTLNEKDNVIADIVKRQSVCLYRGSEENVLLRFIETADKFEISNIIRICADNPFLDMNELEKLITISSQGSYDYVSFYVNNKTPSIKTHFGLWAEYTNREALNKVYSLTHEQKYLEHVTNYFYEHTDKFNVKFIETESKLFSDNNIRLTIDTIDDFNNVQKLYGKINQKYSEYTIEQLILEIRNDKELIELMKKEIRKNEK